MGRDARARGDHRTCILHRQMWPHWQAQHFICQLIGERKRGGGHAQLCIGLLSMWRDRVMNQAAHARFGQLGLQRIAMRMALLRPFDVAQGERLFFSALRLALGERFFSDCIGLDGRSCVQQFVGQIPEIARRPDIQHAGITQERAHVAARLIDVQSFDALLQ